MFKNTLVKTMKCFSQKIQKTVPNHKAPIISGTIQSRYAEVLFTFASKNSKLDVVYKDLAFIKELYLKSKKFRDFTKNISFQRKEQRKVLTGLNNVISKETQ